MKAACMDCGGTGRTETLGYYSELVEDCLRCEGTGDEVSS